MSGLAAEQIDDIVARTLKTFPKPSFSLIASKLTDYPTFKQMLKRDAVKLDASQELQHNIQMTTKQTTKNVGLFADDTFVAQDGIKEINAPWRHVTDNYIWDYKEKMFNTDNAKYLARKIVDLLTQRREATLLDIVEHMESAIWERPLTSDDTLTPWGIAYWLDFPTAGQEGHLGGNISGFSGGPGGIDASVAANEKWRNYVADYDALSAADLVKKMVRAFRRIRFHSPVEGSKLMGGQGFKYKICTGETVIEAFTEISKANNDNLGKDLAVMDGESVFKRIPIQYVPVLDEIYPDSGTIKNPLFMINNDDLKVCLHTENNFKESKPMYHPDKHTVRAVHMDITVNTFCFNRRSHAVFARD